MKPLVGAMLLAAMLLVGAGISWLLAGSAGALAVLAGGLFPGAISVSSILALSFIVRSERMGSIGYQQFVLANFIAKVVLLGGWTAAIVLVTSLPISLFIASLLVNFLAWHIYEAFRYQSAVWEVGGSAGS
ncbi:MAG: hypothetical protein IH971_05040 [Candidatus Marinimicrobia bacterium]|nr:hypothetical protein [Candidatus Neomarinimicrobiota bacterium]